MTTSEWCEVREGGGGNQQDAATMGIVSAADRELQGVGQRGSTWQTEYKFISDISSRYSIASGSVLVRLYYRLSRGNILYSPLAAICDPGGFMTCHRCRTIIVTARRSGLSPSPGTLALTVAVASNRKQGPPGACFWSHSPLALQLSSQSPGRASRCDYM